MTTTNNAAQPVLTDEEILAATYFGQTDVGIIRNGRAIEEAVLSKLRAPVVINSGDRQALEHMANEWADMACNAIVWVRNIKDGIATPDEALENLTVNVKHCRDTQAHVALASAPATCDHQFYYFGDQVKERRCDRCNVLESKASAPVALPDEPAPVRPPMCRISGVNEGVLRRAALRAVEQQCSRCAGSGTIKTMPSWETECQECEGFGVVDCAAPVAGEAMGYSTGIQWRSRQSEQSIKLTRSPQPEYGFVHALYAAPQASAEDMRNAALTPLLARALAEWHEDDGPVTWWAWCGHEWAGEAPWYGTPIDQGWPGYHTHWTPIPGVPAALSAQPDAHKEHNDEA